MRHVALGLLVVSLAAAAAHAEDPRPPNGPQTVRVRLRNLDTVKGYLRGRSTDEVVIYTREGRFRHVPLTDVQRFEVQSRTGSHVKRGALIGALVWVGAAAAASRGALDKWGVASWQSGAVLAGSTALGAVIGSQVPRYGWRATEPTSMAQAPPPALVHVSLRF